MHLRSLLAESWNTPVAVFVALLRTAQISSDAHSHIFQLCERTLSFAVSLREEGEVAWLESPNGLGATAVFAYAEKCQELNFLRFSAVGPHPTEMSGRTAIRRRL